MFRKMQAANQQESQPAKEDELTPHLQLECLDKVSKLPVVEMVAQHTADAYGRLKAANAVTNWTLSTAEATAATVGRAAEQAASHLPQGPLQAVDRTLCSGLELIEHNMPIVKQQPQEIMNQAKGTVASVTNYGWNKANDMLNTKWGAVALSGFDTTASLANRYLDHYLPPQEGEILLQVQPPDEDKVGHTLQTMGMLSGKVRSRVYRAVVDQMHGLKQQSDHSMAQLTHLLDVVPKKEAAEEEARRLVHSVSTFLASVPEKIGHLMPSSMAEQVQQAQNFAQQLYQDLLSQNDQNPQDKTMKSIPDSVWEQSNKVQATLQDIGSFATQLMETFKAKNKEITEAGAQLTIEENNS